MGDDGMDATEDLFAKAEALDARAIEVFKPRTPITTKDLFAGRWSELTAISDAVRQPGLHVVLYGERGVGKTSLANVVRPTVLALDEISRRRDPEDEEPMPERLVMNAVANSGDTFSTIWTRVFGDMVWPGPAPEFARPDLMMSTHDAFRLPDRLSIDDVRRVLSQTSGAVFIIDEFDQAQRSVSREFTELIKALSDLAVDCTVIIVGVSETVDRLVADHASINRAIVQIRLQRMKVEELSLILQNAAKILQTTFAEDAANLIVRISQGLPHYTHLIGLHAVRSAAHRLCISEVERDDVFDALKKAVKQAEQTVTEKHSTATRSPQKSARYRHILLACGLAAARSRDALGYFVPSAVVEPLEEILQKRVTIATFANHLGEFCQDKRGSILERDGQPWGYRYRFCDPLLVPFIFMDGLEAGIATGQTLVGMLS
jgi:hypothetical protein